MTEPTSTAAAAVAAALGGITLDLLGVPYHAVVWGFVGALVTMSQMARMEWHRAFFYGLLSTLAGAALGTFGVELMEVKSKSALVVGSLIGGAGAFALIGTLVRRATKFAAGHAGAAITVPAPLEAQPAQPGRASPTRANKSQGGQP